MLDILQSIKEAAKESNAFENHAAKSLCLEDRLLYLQGLSLVMNADGEIRDVEKNYLLILIKSLELDESIIDSCIDFATQPDKATIQSILKCFRRKPIAQLFLFDALMLSYRDDDISTQEKAVIDELACQFEVAKGIYSDIFDLFCYVKNKNWNECSLYFSMHLLNPKYFSHIFKYYGIDLETASRDFNKTSKKKVINIVKARAKYGLSNEDVLPFLQSKIDRGVASVNNGVYIAPNLSDIKIKEFHISYNKLDETLYVTETSLIKDVLLIDQFLGCVELTESEKYILINGKKKIIKAEVFNNTRLLKLHDSVLDGDLIDIDGDLWEYKKNKSKKNMPRKKCLVSNTKRDFKQLSDLMKLQLHVSLTDKSNCGNIIRFNK